MAISRISAHSAQANSVSITTPSVGDLILVFAHRDGSTTAPSLPTGYRSLGTTSGGSGGTSNSARIGCKISDGTETTSSTWTNATSVAVGVYRGCDPQIPYGQIVTSGAASSTLTFSALSAMQATDNTSWVVGFAGSRTATDVGTNDPTGMADRSSATDVAIWDTDGAVSSWSSQTATINATTRQIVYVIELVAKVNVTIPQLVWHVQAQTNGNYETGNNFDMHVVNASRSGNCLVLCISYAYSAGRTVSITDNTGSTWPAAAVTRTNDAGDLTAKIYVLPNCNPDIRTIRATFDALLEGFHYQITELWGIADSSPVDVTVSGQPTGPQCAVGSMTTTQADDVIVTFAYPGGWGTPYIGSAPTGFRAMPGHRLLSADRWIGFIGMIGIRSGTGAVNPTFYFQSPTAESMNTLSVALKVDGTKGSQATGVRCVGIQKMRMNNGTYVETSFPTWGNLVVVESSETPSQCHITAIKSTAHPTGWTILDDAGAPQCAYIVNATPEQSNVIKISNTGNFLHGIMYDIADAHTDPYDGTQITSGGTVVGPADIPNAPNITPTTNISLILGALNLYVGPPDECLSPSGMIFDCAYHTNMSDLSTMDTGDGYAHFDSTNTNQVSFTWHESAVTTSGWFARATVFKGVYNPIPLPIKSVIFNQAVKRAALY